MALSQRHRSTIYTRLEPILGEEETEAMLAQFPTRDLDQPVSKEFVRAEIEGLRADLHDQLRSMTVWFTGALMAGLGLAATLARILE